MANIREYIGARYVTKIYENSLDPSSAEWESGVTYEPLTMVTYLNSSYLSKRDVPGSVGDPASNPLYWVVTGAYNGQIAALQNQITAINTIIGDSNSGIIKDVNDLQTDVSSLQAEVNSITLSNKTEIILFGDSWADYDHDQNNVRIPQILNAHFGCTVHNYAYGGTGFDYTPNGYDEQITQFAADNIDNDTIKCIILVCGLNDYQRTTTKEQFTTMFQDWYDKLIAEVGNNIPIYWFHNYGISNDLSLTNPTTFAIQYNYYAYVMANLNRPVHCVDTFGWVSSWHNDTHPDSDGSTDFTVNMCKAIEGLTPFRYIYDTSTLTLNNNSITIEYYYNGTPELDCYIKANASDLATITTAASVLYDATPCAKLVAGQEIGFGYLLAANDYNGITIACANPTLIAGYTAYSSYSNTYSKLKMA